MKAVCRIIMCQMLAVVAVIQVVIHAMQGRSEQADTREV